MGLGCPYLKITEQFTSGKLLFGKFCFHLDLHLDFSYSATIYDQCFSATHGTERAGNQSLGILLYVIEEVAISVDILIYIITSLS